MFPILLLASLLGSSTQSALDFRVIIEPHPKGLSPANLLITVHSVNDERESLSAWPGDSLLATLQVPHRGNWILGCRGEGYWCPRLEVGVYDAGREQTLPLFRAAKAVGRIEVPPGLTAPKTLVLQGRANLEGKVIEVVETVTVSQGRFGLDLPRETIDLRSTAPGWTPHYWWSLDCHRDRVELGALGLRPGSSVSGLVVDSQTARPERGVRATLELKTDLDPAQRARLRAASLQSVSDARGFFQIAGVEPGQYQLELRRGKEPETFVDTVEVQPDTEVYLGRIPCRKPVSVAFEVRPPRDARDEPWEIAVVPLTEHTPLKSDVRRLKADRDGRAGVKRLNPDTYEVLVIDSNQSRLLRTQVELQADTQLTLDVPIVAVEGRVLLGASPLSASVALHDTKGPRGDPAAFTSDVDGRFSGWMRRPNGSVIVASINAAQPPVDRNVWMHDVREDAGKLHVEIQLEDFTIRGRVVDETGRPLSARVDALTVGLREQSSAPSDDDGRFSLRGLAAGRYQVAAYRPDRPEMRPQEVELSEGTPSREIVLVMNQGRVLHGRLLSAEGQPVPGAGVELSVLGQALPERYAATDLDGSFRVTVPEEAASAHVQVLSRALPWFAKCVSLPQEEEELTIHLPPQPPARVELLVPNEASGDVSDGVPPFQWVLFSQEGGVFYVNKLVEWEFQQTGRLPSDLPAKRPLRTLAILPGLPAGSYALTRSFLHPSLLLAQTCEEGPLPGLAWSPVAGGDTATISYAGPAAEAR